MYKYNPNGGYWKGDTTEEKTNIEWLNNTFFPVGEYIEEFLNRDEISALVNNNKWVEVFEAFRNETFLESQHFIPLVLARVVYLAGIDFMKYIPDRRVKEIFCYTYGGNYIEGSEDMFDWYD